jgi:hypothetical protein
MNRIIAIVIAVLLSVGPTNIAAAWQSSCGCNSPCEACPPPAPAVPAACGCGDAPARLDEHVTPKPESDAEPVAPLPEPTPAAEAPALQPVPVAPVAKPELPPTTTQPSATPTEEPSTPPAVEPSTPLVEPAPPADQPITPTEEPATPVEQPAAPVQQPTTPVEDIFGGTTEPATSEPTASEPTPAEEPETKTPTDATPAEAPPADTPDEPPPAEAPEANDLFDSFGAAPNTLGEPGGWASTETRIWNDAAGRHACEARLTGVTAEEVVLARVDGDTVRVPYRQLSVDDLRFVRRQIEARRAELGQQSETIVASQAP